VPRNWCCFSTDRFPVELKLPKDADDLETREVPLLNVSSNSQSSAEVHSSSGSLRQRIFRRPGSRSSRQAARSSCCPQIDLLDFGGDLTVYFPSQVFFEEPPSNQTTHYSFLSKPSSSGAVHVPAETCDDTALRNTHQLTTPTSTFSIWTASDTSSSVEDSINMSPSRSSLAGFSVPL
jgi:hypothetical protein